MKSPVRFIKRNLLSLSERYTVMYARFLYRLAGLSAVMHYVKTLRNPTPVLRAFGAQVGEGTIIYPGIVIHAAVEDFSNLRIGNNCRILRECFLDLTDRIEIADTACLAMRTMLITHLNVATSPLGQKELPPHSAPITVGPGAVTFAGVTILKGVTLGECAVVAAGAVVATTVPPWTLVGGNPARLIRRLQPSEKAENVL